MREIPNRDTPSFLATVYQGYKRSLTLGVKRALRPCLKLKIRLIDTLIDTFCLLVITKLAGNIILKTKNAYMIELFKSLIEEKDSLT